MMTMSQTLRGLLRLLLFWHQLYFWLAVFLVCLRHSHKARRGSTGTGLVGRLTQGILFWLAVILLHRCRFCPDMTLTLALPFRVGREVSAGVWPLPRAGPSPRHFCAGHRLCSGPALTLPWAATLQRLVPLTWAPEPCRRRATFALSS